MAKSTKYGFIKGVISAEEHIRYTSRAKNDEEVHLTAWREYLAKIQIDLLGLKLGAYLGHVARKSPARVFVSFDMIVNDVTNGSGGRRIGVGINLMTPTKYPNYLSDNWIRASIMGLIRHEIDERLLFGGVRKYDPHAKQIVMR